MDYKKSIALLICYYGEFPWYFDYFVHSCKYNPTVDFFIFTDTNWPKSLPVNVKLIYKTLNEVSVLASEKLGFEINILYAYKLCDFKPTYGCVFSDFLNGYDFWGHIDLDVIFGDIRNFMSDKLLDRYDLISVRPDWIPGCFLLFKNTPKMNMLFTHSKDYKEILLSNTYHNFDETDSSQKAFTEGKPYYEIITKTESMMHVVKRLEAQNYIKPFFDLFIIEGLPGRLKWVNGRMFYRKRFQILLYHLIYFKKLAPPKYKSKQLPDEFTISPTKIYHKRNIMYSKKVVD